MTIAPDEIVARVQAAGVRLVRFICCGNDNVIRGKSAHAGALADFMVSGIGMAAALPCVNILDHINPDDVLGPAGEVRLVPDPQTFAVMPYPPGEAYMLCDQINLGGTPSAYCARNFLKRMEARAAAEGMAVEAAFEHEFYLAREVDGRYVPADDGLCYSTDGMNRAGVIVGEIVDALDGQGLRPRQYQTEYGRGQQELSIHHAPLLAAADHNVAVRETIRAIGLRHGLAVSFAPKPFANQAGSGWHVHLSLWREGRNLLYDPEGEAGISALGRSFIGGLLDHLPALLAITCPSVNSYRRLAPNMWSSAYTCWGPDNREATVRVPSPFKGRLEASTNLELKPVDGSANPYLALDEIVAAGLDGVQRSLDPGEPLAVNPEALDEAERQRRKIHRYPITLAESLAALQCDAVLQAALGADLLRTFTLVRRSEWEALGSLPVEQELAAHFLRY